MKLAKIKALCTEANRFEVVNGPGCQWLGNGKDFFRVWGARLDIDELDKLLGMNEKKAAVCKWNEYNCEDDMTWQDCAMSNAPYAAPMADVYGYGEKLLALDCDGQVLYIRYAALEALEALEDDRRREFQLRDVGGLHVACLHGMQVDALLEPLGHSDAVILTEAIQKVGRMRVYVPGPEVATWSLVRGQSGKLESAGT